MDEEQKVIPGVPYDLFTGAFLSKITEYEFSGMTDCDRGRLYEAGYRCF